MTQLPSELPVCLKDVSPTITGTYSILLELKRSISDEPDSQRLMYARILGYLILEGPSDQARVTVAQEVVSCLNDNDKLDLGKMYYDHYLCACMLLPLLVSHTPL